MTAIGWPIRAGDHVRLVHKGYGLLPRIPKRLHQRWAVVLVANRATLDVKVDGVPRRVHREHVAELNPANPPRPTAEPGGER